jgi:hypothetical protein
MAGHSVRLGTATAIAPTTEFVISTSNHKLSMDSQLCELRCGIVHM